MSVEVPDPPEWEPDEPTPTVVLGENGEPVSACCGWSLNVTAIERNLMRYRPVGLDEKGALLVDPQGEFLEYVDDQNIEVWCGDCQTRLTIELKFDDGVDATTKAKVAE